MRWCFLVLIALTLVACDNSVEPIAETTADVFAVHGFLDIDTDSQSVRISSMETYESDRLSYQGVIVRSVTEGEPPIEWTHDDSVVLADGSRLYRARFLPKADAEYRLQVLRNGSIATEGVTTVPRPPQIGQGLIEGTPEFLSRKLFLRNFQGPPYNLYIEYEVRVPGESEGRVVLVEYGRAGAQVGPDWMLDIFLTRDRDTATQALGLPRSQDPELLAVRARVDLLSPEWAEGTRSVLGGHGFFGSVGRFRTGWPIPTDTVRTVGYIDAQR